MNGYINKNNTTTKKIRIEINGQSIIIRIVNVTFSHITHPPIMYINIITNKGEATINNPNIRKITISGKNNVPKMMMNGMENTWNIPTNNILGIAS